MQDDELDRILCKEETIIPSSEFTASVMTAVHREASVPVPIAFPWTRVLPGLLASGLAFAVLLERLLMQPGISAAHFRPSWLPVLVQVLETAKRFGVHWIAFSLILAFASMRLSARLMPREETLVR